ncbi:unnamed protein product [Cylicostephanus goldi]|uniref:Uncharacterized protein n=1 Tax=Cylicostephanus goldi TaxID=71465 RepID=A0A3P7MZS0_CYLGO|nr:unnamed protein product [Cylicostephanus goldi]
MCAAGALVDGSSSNDTASWGGTNRRGGNPG